MTPSFPSFVSLTITNTCDLRCQMCGQWSQEGYLRQGTGPRGDRMRLADWIRVVDDIADHGVQEILIRGGEPFLFPGIMDLIGHIRARGVRLSIDTNGTMLDRHATELVELGPLHVTISMDGPEAVHDQVRGVPGTYQKVANSLARLAEAEAAAAERGSASQITKALCFTISQYSYRGLSALPDVARALGVPAVLIVPYYYVPEAVGQRYQRELRGLGCAAYSWQGFHHEESGVDPEVFREQYHAFLANLGDVQLFPYLPMSEEEYLTWFSDAVTPVGLAPCHAVERLLDIQPNGDANFCVDFPDYTFGNVRQNSIAELWNSEAAQRFREYRREQPLAVCLRCGAKYMAELPS